MTGPRELLAIGTADTVAAVSAALVRARDVGGYYSSPADWRDEVLYFLLPDRFSDGREGDRPLLDRTDPGPAPPNRAVRGWSWDPWADSGKRWQGGTISGDPRPVRLPRGLGVSTLWIGPVFQQRTRRDTYHGYGIQDFLDVDPRFGTREDLVALVAAGARRRSASSWTSSSTTPARTSTTCGPTAGGRERTAVPAVAGFYPDPANPRLRGLWRRPGADDPRWTTARGQYDGVWPRAADRPGLHPGRYWAASARRVAEAHAEHKRTDFLSLTTLRPGRAGTRATLDLLPSYAIAITDRDGFRLDTLKHVSFEQGRNFCGAIKEFAARLGKHDFFLVGEVAGGDFAQGRYLESAWA